MTVLIILLFLIPLIVFLLLALTAIKMDYNIFPEIWKCNLERIGRVFAIASVFFLELFVVTKMTAYTMQLITFIIDKFL